LSKHPSSFNLFLPQIFKASFFSLGKFYIILSKAFEKLAAVKTNISSLLHDFGPTLLSHLKIINENNNGS
jgi:hypothetical protein